MRFWLLLKREISYRVMVSWRILVSFRGFFLKIMFLHGEIFEFPSFFFCLKIFFNVNGKAALRHSPCFIVSHCNPPNHLMLHVMLVVFSKSSWWVGVHGLDLRLFWAMVWKLLIIKLFSQWKLNKIKTENCIEIWGCSGCCWKALGESDLRVYFTIFRAKVGEDIDFWVIIVVGNSNKLQKLGLEGNINWALHVFTLGPMTHTTLIYIE